MALDGEAARAEVAGARIVAVQGDITAQEVQAVVNAANTKLQHGGGVAAAIAEAAGPIVQQESNAWIDEHGELRPGQAALTSAGDMPADHIIHVAGPVYDTDSDDNEHLLREAVTAALDAASGADVASVAFPAISAGTYGYPRDEATAVIASTARDWLDDHAGDLDEIRLVGFDRATTDDFAAAIDTAGG